MKRILVVSDMHCGHTRGLSPWDNYSSDISNFLYNKWKEMVKYVGDIDMVIVNGDCVDGSNYKDDGFGLFTSDIHEQCMMVRDLFEPFRKMGVQFVFTDGSKYHVGSNLNGDRISCMLLGGEWLGKDGFIQAENIKIHARHVINYSSQPNSRSTAQRGEQTIAAMQDEDVDIFIRSHTHKFVYSGNERYLHITTPCWKGVDDFIRKKSIEKSDCGWVLITVDGSEYSWEHHVFRIPDVYERQTITL